MAKKNESRIKIRFILGRNWFVKDCLASPIQIILPFRFSQIFSFSVLAGVLLLITFGQSNKEESSCANFIHPSAQPLVLIFTFHVILNHNGKLKLNTKSHKKSFVPNKKVFL